MTDITITDPELLLTALRTEVLRCKLEINELETVGVALKSGQIDTPYAITWLADIGLLNHVLPKHLRGIELSGDTGSVAA